MSKYQGPKKFTLIIGGLILIGIGMVFGAYVVRTGWANKPQASQYEKIGIFLKVLNHVENNYVEEVNLKSLTYGAINGMLATLDPHTNFLPPDVFKEIKVDTSGQFGGLGIEITVKEGILTVISPIEGTPADKAGLKAGDKIVKIEDDFTDKMTLIEAVSKMRGKKGTPVTIQILREGLKEPKTYTIVRAIIKIQPLKSALLDQDYGLARVINFQEGTARDLKKALDQLDDEAKKKQSKLKQSEVGLKGLILDLRNNPGGLLEQAVEVADLFLEDGIIVSTMGRNKENKDIEYAHKLGTWRNIPLIVLVNGSSASASEIVAGALQDHKRGIVVGTKTFGKGSVQQVIDLGDDSGLKLTVAKYYTPKGRSIQEVGLEPDIAIEQIDPETLKEDEKKRGDKGGSWWREANLPRHLVKEDKEEKSQNKFSALIYMDEKFKYDYQLHQAYGYLKSYTIFKGIEAEQPLTAKK